MFAFEFCIIAAFFPVFGMVALRAFRVMEGSWVSASSLGFTTVLLAGALFYDFGVYQYFVPAMVCLLAVLVLTALPSFAEYPMARAADKRFILILTAFGFVTLIGRLPVSNFIFAIGDAGGYVNSANHLARVGTTATQFFPLNQVLLGIFAFVGGSDLTPYGVLFASIASAWFAVLLGKSYLGGWRTGWLVGVLVSLNVLAMWFGRLPYSESLMLAANLGALAYWKIASDGAEANYLNYALFGLFVAVAALTRVTGIIWMLVLSGALLFLCIRKSKRVKPLTLAFVIAAAGYALSIQIALRWGANYYINWQLHEFLPWLRNSQDIVLFHLVWALVLVVLAFLSYRFVPKINPPPWVKKGYGVWTFIGFIAFLFLATVYFTDGRQNWLIANALTRIVSGRYPQNSYYLAHYFTVVAIPVFFIGWYLLFQTCNPFKDERWIVFWLFSALFLMISYIRPTYGLSHDVYMYWDRYFLSDTFIVFLLVVSIGVAWCARRKLASWISIIFIAAYIGQAILWIGLNKDNRYLAGGYQMISWLKSSIPRAGSALFLDGQYKGWVFPNLRRTILTPLAHSFGYEVHENATAPGDFSPDAPPDRLAIKHALDAGKDVYIIRASRAGHKTWNGPFAINMLARRAFVIQVKPSLDGRIFGTQTKVFPIELRIDHVWSRTIDIASTKRAGVYVDNIWTDGDAKLDGMHICPPTESRSLILQTYGYRPREQGVAAVALTLMVNGVKTPGEWLSDRQYRATIPKSVSCIESIEIRSSTFVPASLGINSDTRRLGIDVKRLLVD